MENGSWKMENKTNITRGIYFALITAFISGIANFVNKFAVDAINPPLVFTATKNSGVGLLIIGILILTAKWKKMRQLNRREMVYLLLIGIIGGSIPFYLYFTGLSQIPAINASLIHKTLVFWVALMAIPFLKEKVTPLQILAVLFIFAGNLTVGGFTGFKFSQGELYVLLATVLWAIENILAKKILPKVDPDIVTAARMGFGSLILLGAAALVAPQALLRSTSLTTGQWFWMTITMATLLGYILSWYRALKYAPAITVASVLTAGTLVTNVLSAVYITHKWTVEMAIQTGLISLGIWIFYWVMKRDTVTTKPTISSAY
jgi:drug/metabolite transporter (DMT)-like permease